MRSIYDSWMFQAELNPPLKLQSMSYLQQPRWMMDRWDRTVEPMERALDHWSDYRDEWSTAVKCAKSWTVDEKILIVSLYQTRARIKCAFKADGKPHQINRPTTMLRMDGWTALPFIWVPTWMSWPVSCRQHGRDLNLLRSCKEDGQMIGRKVFGREAWCLLKLVVLKPYLEMGYAPAILAQCDACQSGLG